MNLSDLSFCAVSLAEIRAGTPVAFTWQQCPARPVLQPDSVHLWAADLDNGGWQMDTLRTVLSREERAQSGRFHFEPDRNRFTVRRAILRQIIGEYLKTDPAGIEFAYGALGKPVLATAAGQPALEFNLSSSGPAAVYAFTQRRRIGVDIEVIRRNFDWMEVAGQFFHPREVSCIREMPGPGQVELFFTYWTMKEAYIKARGAGLQRPLLEMDLTMVVSKGQRTLTDDDGARWVGANFRVDDSSIAALVVAS
jgi:4'-phosphopantetheinyl transferase